MTLYSLSCASLLAAVGAHEYSIGLFFCCNGEGTGSLEIIYGLRHLTGFILLAPFDSHFSLKPAALLTLLCVWMEQTIEP